MEATTFKLAVFDEASDMGTTKHTAIAPALFPKGKMQAWSTP